MRNAGAVLLLSLSAALTGCSGGIVGGPGSGPIAIQILPTQATLHPNDTQQFTATVTGTSNTAVTWEVNNVTAGNSTVGTISSSGLYTAPANVPNPSTVTVTAVSQADSTKSASATVVIASPTMVSVSVSPSPATVAANGAQQFTATVTGTSNTAVTWEVNNLTGGNSTVGTISSSGLYTAPVNVPNPSTVTVTAVLQADPTKSGSAQVTIVSSTTVAVNVSPSSAMVAVSGTQQFTATVTGTSNTAVTWEVNNLTGGNSTVGTISSSGLYTAPANVPNPSTVSVTAVSQADPTKSSSAQVTILAGITVVVSPSSVSVEVGAVQQFTATVTGTSNTAVSWEVNNVAGGNSTVGTISSNGLYKAPAAAPIPNPVTVTAVSQADSTKSASSMVTIIEFSNGLVNGHYAFELTGQIPSGPLFLAGSFQADGTGNVTGGTQDRSDVSGVHSESISGTYSVGPDGRGTLTLVSSSGTADYRFVMNGPGRAALIGFNGSTTTEGYGSLAKQDASTFSLSSIASNWAFGVSGMVVSGGVSTGQAVEAGRFTVDSSGNITAGAQDQNFGGVVTPNVPFAGTLGSPDPTTGRAVATLGSLQYAFYIVSSAEFFMTTISPVSPTQAMAFVGRAAQQSGTPFTNGSLSGAYAFEWSGQGGAATSLVAEVGQMTADGNGGISNGTFDLNDLPGARGPVSFTGTYSLDPSGNGRGTMSSLTGSQPASNYAFYMASSASAFFVSADSGSVLAGVALAESGGPFSNSSFAGSYGYTVNGFVTGAPADTSGQLLPDANGNITGAADTNLAGTLIPNQTVQLGSYSSTSGVNGRFTLTILLTGSPQPPPANYVMYLVDPGHGFLVEVDSQSILTGSATVRF
jgi:hypothetical protein